MQTLLLDWLQLCCNVALILLLTFLIVTPLWSPAFRIVCCVATLTLLIVTPLWSPAFKIVCCVAAVWPVCFIYVVLATSSSRSGYSEREASRRRVAVNAARHALLAPSAGTVRK
jgi:hypothetical protein